MHTTALPHGWHCAGVAVGGIKEGGTIKTCHNLYQLYPRHSFGPIHVFSLLSSSEDAAHLNGMPSNSNLGLVCPIMGEVVCLGWWLALLVSEPAAIGSGTN